MNVVPAPPPDKSLKARTQALAGSLLMRDGPHARAFDNLVLALIVISIISVGVESIAALPDWARQVLRVEEIVVVVVFSFEYLLRLATAPNKLAFVFSFYGLVDLIAIVPFFLVGIDARYVRVLRILRLARVLKLQRRVLEDTVARRTAELAERNALLEKAQAQMKAELDAACAMQSAILPAHFPPQASCDGAARMTPATTMAGDFYDFIELPDGRIGLVMADVSGKGVPAAFFMAVSRTNLRELAVHHTDPGACLAHTNDLLCTQNPMDLFVTVFYCIFDPATGTLEYANAGHNPPIMRRGNGSIEALNGSWGRMLGVREGAKFPNHAVQLEPGDRLILYTDGVTEAFDVSYEAYGEQRLIAEIQAHGDGPADSLIERIFGSVTRFAGSAAQSDDITLAVLVWRQAVSRRALASTTVSNSS
ncbi:MAG TPA: SpoIIE family protein phosphatase [Steroidobacteraceae bacterium]|nr:SpoIIE family protein phosphatase [Steroidobacteraceae bacterium]